MINDARQPESGLRMRDWAKLAVAPCWLARAAIVARTAQAFCFGIVALFVELVCLVGAIIGPIDEPFGELSEYYRSIARTGFVGGTAALLVLVPFLVLWAVACGADSGSLMDRAKARVPLLVPVVCLLPTLLWSTLATLSGSSENIVGQLPAWIMSLRGLTLYSCLSLPILILVPFIAWSLAWHRVATFVQPDACWNCGYAIRGLVEPRCPECGTAFDPRRLMNLQMREVVVGEWSERLKKMKS